MKNGSLSLEDIKTICDEVGVEIKRAGNIYFCPFCSTSVAGKGGLVRHIRIKHIRKLDGGEFAVLIHSETTSREVKSLFKKKEKSRH